MHYIFIAYGVLEYLYLIDKVSPPLVRTQIANLSRSDKIVADIWRRGKLFVRREHITNSYVSKRLSRLKTISPCSTADPRGRCHDSVTYGGFSANRGHFAANAGLCYCLVQKRSSNYDKANGKMKTASTLEMQRVGLFTAKRKRG